jgi:hypothetical protein
MYAGDEDLSADDDAFGPFTDDPELCPWCGEDVGMQGGLEAHVSEPCAEYLAELNA